MHYGIMLKRVEGKTEAVAAIRLVRKFTNCSLLDAKNAVEGYSA